MLFVGLWRVRSELGEGEAWHRPPPITSDRSDHSVSRLDETLGVTEQQTPLLMKVF